MITKFKETEIGQIPEDWEAVTLGKITQVRGGIGFPLKYQGSLTGTYPLYKVSDMTLPGNEVYMQSANNYVDSHVSRELRATIFPAQTVIFPKVGAAIYTNKKRMLSCEALIDNNVMGVTVTAIDRCLPYFLYTYFQTIDLTTLSNPGPLPSINAKRINSMEIPLPPLPEQCKIADILSTVDETIEKTDAIIQETQQLKKGLMQKLFTEGIGHTRFKETKIGRIPEEWELPPFDDCVDKEGHTGEYRKLQTKDYLDEGRYPIIDQGQEFIAGYTNDENDVYTGSLPVTIFGDHTLFVKFVNMKFAIGADGTVLLYPNKNKLTDKFFYYLISNHKIKSEGYQRHVKYLKQKWFAIPPLAEQRRIAAILSEVDAKIKAEQDFKSELQQLKKGLMQVLLTGKVRVMV